MFHTPSSVSYQFINTSYRFSVCMYGSYCSESADSISKWHSKIGPEKKTLPKHTHTQHTVVVRTPICRVSLQRKTARRLDTPPHTYQLLVQFTHSYIHIYISPTNDTRDNERDVCKCVSIVFIDTTTTTTHTYSESIGYTHSRSNTCILVGYSVVVVVVVGLLPLQLPLLLLHS